MNVVWLSSYPKSGNTWLATFLYHYFHGKADRNEMIMDFIPDIHELLAAGNGLNENNPNTIMCKSHFLYSDKHPHLAQTAGFIYLIRHPKDMLLSLINFYRLCSESGEVNELALAQSFIHEMGGGGFDQTGIWWLGGTCWQLACRQPSLSEPIFTL